MTSGRHRTVSAALAAAALLLAPALYAAAPAYAPLTPEDASRVLVRVLDTESSLGPLAGAPREVTLGDLVRFHGHPCDGLVAAAEGITLGLKALFPHGAVDRTDLAAVTNASPCYSDAAAYLTGARQLYGTLVIDRDLGDEWLLLRRSTGRAVRVALKEGVKPAELPALEHRLRGVGCDQALILEVQRLQAAFVRTLLTHPAPSLYTVETLPSFPYPVTGTRPDAAMARCGREPHRRGPGP